MSIPTAKDFWNKACKNQELKSPADIMIEFTKMHVEDALKQAKEKATVNINGFIQEYDKDCCVDEKSILNAYPLQLIR